jgi:hypothetical protein
MNNEYPYIEAWGRYLGSLSYYIRDQTDKARRDKAPRTAIYERDGKWITFEEVTNPHAIWAVNQELERMGIAK